MPTMPPWAAQFSLSKCTNIASCELSCCMLFPCLSLDPAPSAVPVDDVGDLACAAHVGEQHRLDDRAVDRRGLGVVDGVEGEGGYQAVERQAAGQPQSDQLRDELVWHGVAFEQELHSLGGHRPGAEPEPGSGGADDAECPATAQRGERGV